MALAAIVVSHNHSDSKLHETLAALSKQTVGAFDIKVASRNRLPDISEDQVQIKSHTFEGALVEILPTLTAYEWVWVLSDFQVPNANAFEELLKVAETSATAALVAPKLMNAENPRLISNFGITLTPRGSLHQLVIDELDQSQHDSLQDAMAASLEGSLVSAERVIAEGGFGTTLNALAGDLELAIRLRLRGLRVLLAPKAKVIGLDLKRVNARTTDHDLKLFYYPAPLAFAYFISLPILVVVEALWLMAKKQPEKVISELTAGFKAFFGAIKVALNRKSLSNQERKNLRSLRSLYATKAQVSTRRNLQGYEAATLETSSVAYVSEPEPRFFASGAGWVAFALLALSWQYWPLSIDLKSPALIPIGDNWLNVFTATGSGFQNLGVGFYSPSEPFNWLLLALGSLTFWSPGVALSLVFFAAKSIAFATAFKASSLLTSRTWVAILAGLSYAFWPSFISAQSEGRLPAVLAHLVLPVFVFAFAKVLGFKLQSATRTASWGYTATAALTAAACSLAAPSLTFILALVWLTGLLYKPKKIGYLIWVPFVLAALWLPTALYRITALEHPLTLLADPGQPLSSRQLPVWQLAAGMFSADWFWPMAVATALIALISLAALVGQRTLLSLILWSLLFVALVAGWVAQQIQFVGNSALSAVGENWVNGSAHPFISVVALALALLAALALDGVRWRRAAGIFGFGAVATLLVVAILTPSQLIRTDGRVVPALVRAEANQGSALKMLVVYPEQEPDKYSATLVSSAGIHLADLNTNYRFAVAKNQLNEVAMVAADLVAASQSDLGAKLKQLGVGYVLVPVTNTQQGRQLVSNIDSVLGLNSIGETEFGQLWRLSDLTEIPIQQATSQDLWSVTKGVQLTILLLFGLLAIPTRRREVAASVANQDLDSFATEVGENDA